MKDFRDNIVCVTVSTFLIFMFVDQLLLVDVFSLSCTTGISLTPTKQQWWTSVINIVKIMTTRFFYRFSPISIFI